MADEAVSMGMIGWDRAAATIVVEFFKRYGYKKKQKKQRSMKYGCSQASYRSNLMDWVEMKL